MMPQPQPSEACFALIRRSEGLRTAAYQDTGGVWTIGYGHTRDVYASQTCTPDEAEDMLEADAHEAWLGVCENAMVPLTQGQVDALTDFVFNLGAHALAGSHLLHYLNAGETAMAAHEFSKWVYGSGRILPGLVARRSAERALFLG